jgi:general nucleoside transport system permease protein
MTSLTLMDMTFLATLVAASLRIATPILFAALGETVAESAGILNIGIEGTMVIGAVTGFLVSFHTGDQWLGFAAAFIAGGAVGLVFGYVTVERGADHVVTGIVLNIFCFGMASLAFKGLFTRATEVPEIKVMSAWRIPWLSQLDFFGRALFSQTPVVYIAFGVVPIFWFLLFRTQWGLRVRSVGENPAAAESAGLDVWRIRLGASALGGAMAGIAGATLAIAQLGLYLDNMTAGRGFIALALVVFGAWNPWRVAGAALIFGAAEALQLRMQAIGIAVPHALLLAIPYLLTIVVIAAFAGKASYPAAMNTPYPRRGAAKQPNSDLAVSATAISDARAVKTQYHQHTG